MIKSAFGWFLSAVFIAKQESNYLTICPSLHTQWENGRDYVSMYITVCVRACMCLNVYST